MKAYNLTNQKFERLTAIYKCNYKKGNKYPWHCICDCGNECDVPTSDLIKGKVKSCGCLRKEKASQIGAKTGVVNGKKRAKDLSGQRFGQLIAISPTNKRRGTNIIWYCECSCGNTIEVASHDLISGNTSSCGCLKSKGQAKIAQLLNENNIPFVTEKTFESFQYNETNGNPRFDFFVNNKYLIEYDGIQHYNNIDFFHLNLEQQKERDLIKNNWCKENKISLIRIPYYHLSKLTIEDLLLETSGFII